MKVNNIKILERKDGRYFARFTWEGKRISVYGKSEAEVKKKLKDYQKEIDKGNVPVIKEKLQVGISQWLEVVKKPKVREKTYDRIESTFKNHIENTSLGRMQIGVIKTLDIQKFINAKCDEGKLGVSSIKKIYELLSGFFRYYVGIREIDYNPMTLVELPHASHISKQSKELEILTEDEVKQVMGVIKIGKYRYGEVIAFLLLTGIRAEEVRALKITDFDFTNNTVHIQRGITNVKDRREDSEKKTKEVIGEVKTKTSNRIIPLSPRAVLAVKNMIKTTANKETGFLVCTSQGKIVTHANLQNNYDKILKRANVKHMGLHSTRHSYATHMLKSVADSGRIKEVSELLGHSDVSVTYRYYIKTDNNDKRNLANQLDELLCAV